MKKESGIPVIEQCSFDEAIQEAREHFNKLSLNKRIGFKAVDYINLARALIISKSFISKNNVNTLPLSEALTNIPNIGNCNGEIR